MNAVVAYLTAFSSHFLTNKISLSLKQHQKMNKIVAGERNLQESFFFLTIGKPFVCPFPSFSYEILVRRQCWGCKIHLFTVKEIMKKLHRHELRTLLLLYYWKDFSLYLQTFCYVGGAGWGGCTFITHSKSCLCFILVKINPDFRIKANKVGIFQRK